MRILHTSDWHLGQSFFSKNRKSEHQAFIDWLLNQVDEQQVDAVIIAGDVFDTGTPPSYARELYNQFVVALQQHNCALVVLAGNHDSVSMLNESKQVLACLNTDVIAGVEEDLSKQVIVLNNNEGQPGALVCAIPFLRPRDLIVSEAGESGVDKQVAIAQAIKTHYSKVYQLALEKRKDLDIETLPIIATGHLTALGVSQSESVRDIYIGSLDGFSADGFPPADYIALGHIHRPQKVTKHDTIRYSGSPIPLSFDELSSQKQVVLVDFGQQTEVTTLDVPMSQPMELLKTNLEQLEVQVEAVQAKYPDQTVWLALEIESQDYLSDLQQRVANIIEPFPVEVLQLKRSRKQDRSALAQQAKETLSELTPSQVFEKRLDQEVFEGDEQTARKQRIEQKFATILNELKEGEA
ncbi:exonuclease subunit SbcD [Vibrio sp. SCSIO 43136]|uniref:exonuclease subunit SbcD n=1 Tax=Vibrio sp. SCSIO 43136 TaxID=2819101 RepID=UPI002075A11A|nr:exonuclease subunit SbcD [Vibrio sp. SCSIO 43136]USD67128.1 exonuclease subunit SbcD [Vibrio sp. SCSIO 43136]